MDRFDVRELREGDAEAVAAAHEACFQHYFLTQLGRVFLRRYYAEFCRHSFDYGAVAMDRENGALAAFVVGTCDAPAHFRSFYRRNMLVFLGLVAFRFITNPIVRSGIWGRMAHLKTALKSLVPGVRQNASRTVGKKGPRNQCPLRLLSIAAMEKYRGTGVAGLVNDYFEELLRTDGHKRVGLSVLADNERAIGFYKKVGWEVTYSSSDGWWFEKDL